MFIDTSHYGHQINFTMKKTTMLYFYQMTLIREPKSRFSLEKVTEQ